MLNWEHVNIFLLNGVVLELYLKIKIEHEILTKK